MRVTRHNSRGAKNSPEGYSARHNDRNFDLGKADNIDIARSDDNLYWHIGEKDSDKDIEEKDFYKGKDKGKDEDKDKDSHKSFSEVELDYYREHFYGQYEATMEHYKATRQHGRVIGFEDWCKCKRFCPEEQVVQIGNMDSSADRATFRKVMIEYIKAKRQFLKKHNMCYQTLDIAMHFDEAVGHMHERGVWRYIEDGMEKVGQNKALELAGIPLPYPDKTEGRYNNRKMTYDRIMRDMLLDICEKHGLAVEREPERGAVHGRSKKKLIADKKRDGTAVESRLELAAENERLAAENATLVVENVTLATENARFRAEQRARQLDAGQPAYGRGLIDLER